MITRALHRDAVIARRLALRAGRLEIRLANRALDLFDVPQPRGHALPFLYLHLHFAFGLSLN